MTGNHIAFVALPGVVLLLLVISWLGSRYREAILLRLQAWQGRKILCVPAVKNMPESAEIAEIQALAEQLSTRRGWIGLNELLGELDHLALRASDGRRIYDIAIDSALIGLRTAPDMTTLMERLEEFEAAAATGKVAMQILHARALALVLRLAQERYGAQGNWLAGRCAAQIDALVETLDPESATSPSLAEAIYHASAVLNDGPEALQSAFRFWLIVDPGNARAYVHHAARLAAFGPAAEAALADHLAETEDTLKTHGPRTLLMAQLAVARTRPIWQTPGWDPDTVYEHLGRIASGPKGQLLVNCIAQRLMDDGLDAVAVEVVRNYMTHWVTPIWPDKRAFHALFWRAMMPAAAPRPQRPENMFDDHRVLA